MGDHWLRDPYGCVNPVTVPDDLDEFARGISDTFNGTSMRFDDVSDNSISYAHINHLKHELEDYVSRVANLEARIQHLEELLKESMPLLF